MTIAQIMAGKDIIKIFVEYTGCDKEKKIKRVKSKYFTSETSYFVLDVLKEKFIKPKPRTKLKIIIYTPDGVYSAMVKILDADVLSRQPIFEVETPKEWKFQQLRFGTRKDIELPVKITFGDDSVLECYTKNISVSGFSLYSQKALLENQKKIPANCEIELLGDALEDGLNNIFNARLKFVRQTLVKDDYFYDGYYLIAFKFFNPPKKQFEKLKKYLLFLD